MRRVAALASLLLACGRSGIYEPQPPAPPPPPPPKTACALMLDAEALDFGSVDATSETVRTLTLTNVGTAACHLTKLAIAGDPGFDLLSAATATIARGDSLGIGVRFHPLTVTAPFDRTGTLTFSTDDAHRPSVSVALKAHLVHCAVEVRPAMLTFASVRPGQSDDQSADLVNTGDARCEMRFALEGDPAFTRAGPVGFNIGPGMLGTATVRFTAPGTLPAKHTGTLRVTIVGEAQPLLLPLEATVQLCAITASPNPFDFGNVVLNSTATHAMTLTNGGTDTCVLSGFFLTGNSDFSLPAPPGTLTVAPGLTTAVLIRFVAFDSAPPHQRTATLHFTTNDPQQVQATVPVSGFINTICTTAGQFIYTVDRNGTFSRFDPASLSSTTIGTLACMNGSLPFSMNLDQSAVAWVIFDDGRLFKVDVSNASCTPTTFMPGQAGFLGFGMGSVFNSSTGQDTLFIAGGPNDTTLGTLDLSALHIGIVSTTIDAPRAELAGTGDGQLWAFTPSFASTSGIPFIVRLEPSDGGTIERHDLAAVTTVGGYAIKFWGGAFYIFIGPDVWKVPRNTLVPGTNAPTMPPVRVFTQPGLEVVGAGVSTCAPVIGP